MMKSQNNYERGYPSMDIKLIAVDLDNTFLKKDKSYDLNKLTRILHRLTAYDIKFVIATGNYIPTIKKYFDASQLEDLYIATDNGNILTKNNHVINKIIIERTLAENIYNYIINRPGYYPFFSTGEIVYVQKPVSNWAKDRISFYFNQYRLIDHFSEIPVDEDIVKIELFCEHPLNDIKELMNHINNKFPMITSETSGDYMLDIYHEDGGKGSALSFLQNKYQISPEHTMSFGDSLNDKSMMEVSKYSMAMENSDPDFFKYCEYVIGTNEDQAVLEILEEYTSNWDTEFLKRYKF